MNRFVSAPTDLPLRNQDFRLLGGLRRQLDEEPFFVPLLVAARPERCAAGACVGPGSTCISKGLHRSECTEFSDADGESANFKAD